MINTLKPLKYEYSYPAKEIDLKKLVRETNIGQFGLFYLSQYRMLLLFSKKLSPLQETTLNLAVELHRPFY